MFDLPVLRGKALDHIALIHGVKRKRWLWIFRERDSKLRQRLLRKQRAWKELK